MCGPRLTYSPLSWMVWFLKMEICSKHKNTSTKDNLYINIHHACMHTRIHTYTHIHTSSMQKYTLVNSLLMVSQRFKIKFTYFSISGKGQQQQQ